MTESVMDNQALLKRSLVTAGAMVGACVLFVGTLTLVAVGIVNHAVAPADAAGPAPAASASARVKIGAPAPPGVPGFPGSSPGSRPSK